MSGKGGSWGAAGPAGPAGRPSARDRGEATEPGGAAAGEPVPHSAEPRGGREGRTPAAPALKGQRPRRVWKSVGTKYLDHSSREEEPGEWRGWPRAAS